METIQKYLDKIETEIDLMNCYNEGMLFSDFEDAIMESINNEDIIYYSEAMSYLIENDTSLKNSLCLASDIGCQVSDINSELLASLLYQENLRNEWYDISEEIEEYFEEYLEYLETLNENKE
jgi:hypothetical protein